MRRGGQFTDHPEVRTGPAATATLADLINGMAYTVRIKAIDHAGNASPGVETSGVPVRIVGRVGVTVTDSTIVPGTDHYAGAEFANVIQKAVVAWRSVLSGMVHSIKCDGAMLPSATVADESGGTIAVVTCAEVEAGTHSVAVALNGSDSRSRVATAHYQAMPVAGGLYCERDAAYPAPWDDFPDAVIITLDAGGNPVIVDQTNGRVYATIASGAGMFRGQRLAAARFSAGELVLTAVAAPRTCWTINLFDNVVRRMDGESVVVCGSTATIVAKRAE